MRKKMSYQINAKQIESIKKLIINKRYEHLIKKIADTEELWTIKMDGWFLLFGDDGGNEYIPIWPHPEYIKDFQTEEWRKSFPEKINLEDWLEKWIPGMIKDKKRIAVFPVIDQKYNIISPEEFEKDIRNELEQYE